MKIDNSRSQNINRVPCGLKTECHVEHVEGLKSFISLQVEYSQATERQMATVWNPARYPLLKLILVKRFLSEKRTVVTPPIFTQIAARERERERERARMHEARTLNTNIHYLKLKESLGDQTCVIEAPLNRLFLGNIVQ